MKRATAQCLGTMLIATFCVQAAWAGTVTGKIQVQGTKVKTAGAKSGKDVVVYLEKIGDVKYPAATKEHAVIDQSSLVFIPHVLAIQKGVTVDFINSDTTDHNVFCVDNCCKIVEDIEAKKPKFLDLGNFGGGAKASHTFDIPGEGVMLCKLHPEMSAYVVVLESPYFVIAEIDGDTQSAQYVIENVPPGEYVLKAWHKKLAAPEQKIIVVEDGKSEANITLAKKERKRRS